LRDDVATEHPREGIAHETFKAPIKTLNAAHLDKPPHSVSFLLDPIRVRTSGHCPRRNPFGWPATLL
jgi:hypothetical protein